MWVTQVSLMALMPTVINEYCMLQSRGAPQTFTLSKEDRQHFDGDGGVWEFMVYFVRSTTRMVIFNTFRLFPLIVCFNSSCSEFCPRRFQEVRGSSFSEVHFAGFRHVSGVSGSLILLKPARCVFPVLWLKHFVFQLLSLLFLLFLWPFIRSSIWSAKVAGGDPEGIMVMALGLQPVALRTLNIHPPISLSLMRMCNPLALLVGLSRIVLFKPPILNSKATSINL